MITKGKRKVTAMLYADVEADGLYEILEITSRMQQLAEKYKKEFPELDLKLELKERRGPRRTHNKKEFVSRRKRVTPFARAEST